MADEWNEEIEKGEKFSRTNYAASDNKKGNEVDYEKPLGENSNKSRNGFGGQRGAHSGKRVDYGRAFSMVRGRKSNTGGNSNGTKNSSDAEPYSPKHGNNRSANDNNEGNTKDRGSGIRRGSSFRGHGRNNNAKTDGENNKSQDKNDDKKEEKKRELYIPPEPTEDESEMFSQGISTGINFSRYDSIPVKISGDDAPKPISSFQEAQLKQIIMNNIQKSDYRKPTPIQKNGIPIILAKRDLMACAQTGSGKTAAFLLPIIHNLLVDNHDLTVGKPQALIVSPTRELAIQIFEEARKFAHGSYLKICIVYGGTGVKYQGDKISKGCHILVATPGRLLDFCDRGFMSFEDCHFVVLDEADRMLDMGFLPDVEKIMDNPTMRSQTKRQTLMFSATFPQEIQHLAGRFLKNYLFIAIGIIGGACTDVEQNFHEVTRFDKRDKLLEILDKEQNNVKGTMVFVETQRNADFLASFLSETKYPTTSIHGARFQRERELALKEFKNGKMSVLIATSVAARGLDIKNVDHVINYDLPKSIDEYVHRIGRTGRLGNKGMATSFFDPLNDALLAPDLIKILEQADQEVPQFLITAGRNRDSSFKPGDFGGRDVRTMDKKSGIKYAVPQPHEPDEQW